MKGCLPCMMLGGLGMFLSEDLPTDQGPTVFMKVGGGGFAPITPRPDLGPLHTGLYTLNQQGQYVPTTPLELKPPESTLDKIGKVFANIGAAAPAVAATYQSFRKPPVCVPPQVAKQDPVTGVWKCEVPGTGDGSATQTNWGAVALVGGGFVVAGLALYLIMRKKK